MPVLSTDLPYYATVTPPSGPTTPPSGATGTVPSVTESPSATDTQEPTTSPS